MKSEKEKEKNRNRFFQNIRSGERFEILSILTGRKRQTIKANFNAERKDVWEDKNFLEYFNKYFNNKT